MRKILVVLLVFIFTVLASGCGYNNGNYLVQQTTELPTDPPALDLSAFEGDCPITIEADIEKEADTWLLDVNIKATNNSDKHITQLLLYFVKCYNDDNAIESWKNCDILKLTDISAGETKDRRWVLGTTDQGAREYFLYVAYVLFDDGSSWGEEIINHEAVVTVGVKANVCLYGSGIVTTSNKTYVVTYNAKIISNSSVGDLWSYGMKYGDTMFYSGEEIIVGVGETRGPILTIYASESDAEKNDYAQKDIHFGHLSVGQSETKTEQIIVTQNDGRYVGHKACVEFIVTVTCTSE